MKTILGTTTMPCHEELNISTSGPLISISRFRSPGPPVFLVLIICLACGCANPGRDSFQPEMFFPAESLKTGQKQVLQEPIPTSRNGALPFPLTLDEAVQTALARNPDIVAALETIHRSEALLRKARGAFFPLLTLDVSALRADAPSTYLFKRIDQRDLAPLVDFNDPGKITNYEAGLTLRYDLFSGGRDRAAVNIAGTDLELARLNRQRVQNDLISAVNTTFHDIITADELAVAEAEAVNTVKAQVSDTESRFRAGAVLRDEVLSLQVRLAGAEDRLIAARNAGRLARAALASLLAADTAGVEGLKCKDVPPPGIPGTFEAGLEMAKKRNPAFLSAGHDIDRARLVVKKAEAGFYPTVGVFARYYHDDETADFKQNDVNWILGADLSWNLFNGLRDQASRAAAGAAVRRAEARFHRARLDLERRVREAYLRLESARSRRKVTEVAVERAVETLALVTQRYKKGAVTITRYLEAEQDRTLARVNAIRARCMERRSQSEVARVLGWWAGEREGEP